MEPITIQCTRHAMLSSASISLFPINVYEFGGVLGALVYQQINYLSEPRFHDGQSVHAARISYTRLSRLIPSTTRRTIIKAVAALQNCGAITVLKTKRVNLLAIHKEYKFKTLPDERNGVRMLVFNDLLAHMSILEAMALQQIHVRCVGKDGSVWIIRTLSQLQSDIFPFISSATVSRLMQSLRKKGLIYVKPYSGENGLVNSYRVNYEQVAVILGISVPDVKRPFKHSGKWIHPVYPLGGPTASCQNELAY